ncbi:Lethal(2) Giant Larvae Protein 1 [Manis pentadactyla]|nr:Lethal(2) Giant Larvae Protein 1 [Manis pentadactyla]
MQTVAISCWLHAAASCRTPTEPPDQRRRLTGRPPVECTSCLQSSEFKTFTPLKTHRSGSGSPDSVHSKEADNLEPPEAMLLPMSIDWATGAYTTLNRTGDITLEDVKNFLGSSEESVKNLRNPEEVA